MGKRRKNQFNDSAYTGHRNWISSRRATFAGLYSSASISHGADGKAVGHQEAVLQCVLVSACVPRRVCACIQVRGRLLLKACRRCMTESLGNYLAR